MSVGIGVVILILVVAAVLLGRAGAGGGAAVFLLIATFLFVLTPMGSGVPGAIGGFVEGVSTATERVQEAGR